MKYKRHINHSSFRTVFKSFYKRYAWIKYELDIDIKFRLPKYMEFYWYAKPNYKTKYYMKC